MEFGFIYCWGCPTPLLPLVQVVAGTLPFLVVPALLWQSRSRWLQGFAHASALALALWYLFLTLGILRLGIAWPLTLDEALNPSSSSYRFLDRYWPMEVAFLLGWYGVSFLVVRAIRKLQRRSFVQDD